MQGNIPPLFEQRMVDNMKALKIVFTVIIVVYTVRVGQAIVMALEPTED